VWYSVHMCADTLATAQSRLPWVKLVSPVKGKHT
jgi:hypothetical protein